MARALWWWLPKPDLVFFLDAPADVLWRRKQEVERSELDRQRNDLALVRQHPGGHVLDGSRPIDLVAGDIQRVVRAWMRRDPSRALRRSTVGWARHTAMTRAVRPFWLAAATRRRDRDPMTSGDRSRRERAPNWFESLLFLLLMTGPPKFRGRDPLASLQGAIDDVVLVHVAVWLCGGLWVLTRLYSSLVRRGVVPIIDAVQIVGALLIVGLSLSMWDSPGVLLTGFTLGQFAVMLGFVWVFTSRFGASSCLRHLFAGAGILALVTVVTLYLAPDLVADDIRVRGDYIADSGIVAALGLVFCLSRVPPLIPPVFWSALALFGGLLAVSRTRSAYIAFLAFLAFGFVYGKRLPVRKLVVPIAAVAFVVVTMDALTTTVDYFVREQESVSTLSDRLPLWEHLTTVVMRDSPLTGLGYYSATRLVASEFNPGLGNAHSVFFEVLVGGGVVGAALYLVLCASLVWCAVRVLRVADGQPNAVAAVGLLCIALPLGLATSSGIQPGPLGFVFWSLTALLPELRRQACPPAQTPLRSLAPSFARRLHVPAGHSRGTTAVLTRDQSR